MLTFWEVNHKRVLNFVKNFSASMEIVLWLLSFNFVAAVTVPSDFGAQENIVIVSIVSPSICHEVMGLDAMIFVF